MHSYAVYLVFLHLFIYVFNFECHFFQPLFKDVSKLWFELQDEAELLNILNNITVSLKPFLVSQAKMFSEAYLDTLLEGEEVKTDIQRMAASSGMVFYFQMPEPPQLAPLDVEEQWVYSEFLPDGRAPHPISKGVPATLRRTLISAACIRDLVLSVMTQS
ncbi:hypothetical protein ILYODFUR_033575 [Ilyodon furcidens]|uniref:Uncharacterized protein n=1 Tax=Ilyodon furcidens TaxID=33524 RepID=A0ABV0VJY4_9TELE